MFGGEFRLQAGSGGDEPALEEEALFEEGLPELTLGKHFFIGLGVIVCPWRSGRHAAEAEVLGGFSSWSTGSDASADRLTTFAVPLNLLGYYRYELRESGPEVPVYLRVGAGLAYQMGQGIGSFGKYSGINYDIDSAFGAVFEASLTYAVVGLGVRYTRIGSELAGDDTALDMSSLAAFVSVVLEPGLQL